MNNPRHRLTIYLPLILSLVLVAGIITGLKLAPVSMFNKNVISFRSEHYNKVNDIINYILQDYVDSITRNNLTENAIQGILDELDPHSQYIPAEQLTEVNEQLMGNFEGIGIQFRIEDDSILVIHTIDGGPSEKVGIMGGDRIVKINDSLVAGTGLTDRDAVKLLKGPRGSEVAVSIYRRSMPELMEFNITRDVIPSYSVDVSYMVNDTTGFIKLNRFSATTYSEFNDALKTLVNSGMKDLILDLRGNTGGYLQAAIEISDEFLEENQLIVFTKGKNRPGNYSYATKKGRFQKGRLVIIIDEGSASASEIVAGAVQDNDRGIIVGRRSFGKGLVQEQLNLPDGSALRLTVARYYTPAGRCIQRPYQNGKEEYYHEFLERVNNDSITDTIPPDTIEYRTTSGRIVYGGGGIMPDVVISERMHQEQQYLNKLARKGLIHQFTLHHVDNHRKELQQYDNVESFFLSYQVSDNLFREFMRFASDKGVKPDKELSYSQKKELRVFLKAFIGRYLFDDKGFYPIYHQIDEPFQKALEIIDSGDTLLVIK